MIIKKGTQVKIITGKDRGKTGEILEIDRKQKRVKIKSINMIKKHLKPTKENKGGIISKENFIHLSNIKNIDLKKKRRKKLEVNDTKIKISYERYCCKINAKLSVKNKHEVPKLIK